MKLRSLALAGTMLTALTLAACSDDADDDPIEEGAEDVLEGGADALEEGANALNEGAAALDEDPPAMAAEDAPALEEPPAMAAEETPALEEPPAMAAEETPALEEPPAMAADAPAMDADPAAEDGEMLTLADFTGNWGETVEACTNDPLVIAEDIVTAGGTGCDVTSTEGMADGVAVTLVCTVGDEAQQLDWTVTAVGDAPFDAINITAGEETTAFNRC